MSNPEDKLDLLEAQLREESNKDHLRLMAEYVRASHFETMEALVEELKAQSKERPDQAYLPLMAEYVSVSNFETMEALAEQLERMADDFKA